MRLQRSLRQNYWLFVEKTKSHSQGTRRGRTTVTSKLLGVEDSA